MPAAVTRDPVSGALVKPGLVCWRHYSFKHSDTIIALHTSLNSVLLVWGLTEEKPK